MVILKTNHVHGMAFVCKLAFFQCCTHHTLFHSINSSLALFSSFLLLLVAAAIFFPVIYSLYHYYYIYVFLSIFFQFTHSYGVVCMPVVFSVAVRIQNNRKSTNSESWAISFTCCRVDNPNGKRRRRKKNETINKTGKQCQPTYYLDSGSFLLQRSWVFRLVYIFCCCHCCCCLLT